MEPLTLVLLAVGLVFLIVGADLLVRGASRLALGIGLTPLVVGLTIVAAGTSSPELAVSVQASYAGQADLAFGNVVGSNIFNVLFILGVSAVIAPLVVSRQLVRSDVPVMVGAAALLLALSLDGLVSRADGLVLVALLVGYTTWLIRVSRRAAKADLAARADVDAPADVPRGWKAFALQIAFIAAGLTLLVVGSGWLVDGAVEIARAFGLSELVIGLTIVAAGTSLPEVATSIVATIRGERDIAVGNVVGSNIFNVLCVMGLSSVVSPDGVGVADGAVTFDAVVMLAVCAACLPVFFNGYRIARWEGALFLGYYVAYVSYLVLHATDHAALPDLRTALVWFAFPLTAITFAVVSVRAARAQRAVSPVP